MISIYQAVSKNRIKPRCGFYKINDDKVYDCYIAVLCTIHGFAMKYLWLCYGGDMIGRNDYFFE